MHALGVAYEFGLPGLKKDPRAAQAWFVRAADAGSQYRLGLLYVYPHKGL